MSKLEKIIYATSNYEVSTENLVCNDSLIADYDTNEPLMKLITNISSYADSDDNSLDCNDYIPIYTEKIFKSPMNSYAETLSENLLQQNQIKKKDENIDVNFEISIVLKDSGLFSIYNSDLYYDDLYNLVKIKKEDTAIAFDSIIKNHFPQFYKEKVKLNYIKIYSGLMSCSELVITDETVPKHTDEINLRDLVYNVKERSTRRRVPGDYFFSYIDVSYEEIINAESNYASDFFDAFANGDESLYRRIFEVVGIIISNYVIKGFFYAKGCPDGGNQLFVMWSLG